MTSMEKIAIYTKYITLQAALKLNNVIHSGGEIKHFLMTEKVWVNDVLETRRGRKLYPGDQIRIGKDTFQIVKEEG